MTRAARAGNSRCGDLGAGLARTRRSAARWGPFTSGPEGPVTGRWKGPGWPRHHRVVPGSTEAKGSTTGGQASPSASRAELGPERPL